MSYACASLSIEGSRRGYGAYITFRGRDYSLLWLAGSKRRSKVLASLSESFGRAGKESGEGRFFYSGELSMFVRLMFKAIALDSVSQRVTGYPEHLCRQHLIITALF